MASVHSCEIVKVETKDRYADKPKLIVTATAWGVDLTFEVPAYRIKTYQIGRRVELAISPAK